MPSPFETTTIDATAPAVRSATVEAIGDYGLSDGEQDLVLSPGGAYSGSGTDGANRIEGNDFDNVLLGLGGNDTIVAGEGDDQVSGGSGDDVIDGGDGADRISGDAGSDTIRGGAGNDELAGDGETNFSAIATAQQSGPVVEAFLHAPSIARMSAWVRFDPDLPADIFFGIDQEFIEGLNDPIRYAGADWMGLAGVTREGLLGVRVGTPEERAGTPGTDPQWTVRDLGVQLEAGTWYRLSSVVNFDTRDFVSFSIEGVGVDVSVDLSGLSLSYAEYAPSDERALGNFLWAARVYEDGTVAAGLPRIDFDEVVAGVDVGGTTTWTSYSGFEDGTPVVAQPVEDGGLAVSSLAEGAWYFERPGVIAMKQRGPGALEGEGYASLFALGDSPFPAPGGADIIDGGAGDDVLRGGGDGDRLIGGLGADRLDGGDGDDTLDGGEGADTLAGGAGIDTLDGGAGDDLFLFVDADDTVVEHADGGNDTVIASVDFAAPAHVEAIIADDARGGLTLSGNASDNTIIGGAGGESLYGLDGADWLDGAAGDDWLAGGAGADVLLGGTGRDVVQGGAGADMLTGNADFGPGLDGATDRFVYAAGDLADVILGFDVGEPGRGGDLLDLYGAAASLADPVLDVALFDAAGIAEVTLADRGAAPSVQIYLYDIESVAVLEDNILIA